MNTKTELKRSISLLIFLQLTGIMAFSKTEEQKYKVARSEKEFEIRFYPSATMATSGSCDTILLSGPSAGAMR